MKQKQKSKLEMFNETARLLEKNKGSWSGIPELKNAVEEFNSNKDGIDELHKGKNLNITESLENKTFKRKELVKKSIPVGNVLQVYAYDTGKKKLASKISFSRDKLNKLNDKELINKCRRVLKTAQRLYSRSLETAEKKIKGNGAAKLTKNKINAYGLTTEMIEELERSSKAFGESILKLKDAISHKKSSLKKISDRFKQNEKLLKYKIDKLMTLFESSDASFYDSYNQARIINEEVKDSLVEKPEPIAKTTEVKTEVKKESPAAAIQKSGTRKTKKSPSRQPRSPSRQPRSAKGQPKSTVRKTS